jgi:hypothetical protein
MTAAHREEAVREGWRTCEQWMTRMFSKVSMPRAERMGCERANWFSVSARSSGESTVLFLAAPRLPRAENGAVVEALEEVA